MWMGDIINNQSLSIKGNQAVTAKFGAALGMSVNGDLAQAAYNLYEFNTTPDSANIASVQDHPEKFKIVCMSTKQIVLNNTPAGYYLLETRVSKESFTSPIIIMH